MAAKTVTVSSKPHQVGALRATWRASAEHAAEQLKRFLRLTLLSAIPAASSLLAGGQFDRKTLLAFILPFAEVAFRQVFPALGAAGADAAPGVTIVPAEVTPAANDSGHAEAGGLVYLVIVLVIVLVLLRVFHLI